MFRSAMQRQKMKPCEKYLSSAPSWCQSEFYGPIPYWILLFAMKFPPWVFNRFFLIINQSCLGIDCHRCHNARSLKIMRIKRYSPSHTFAAHWCLRCKWNTKRVWRTGSASGGGRKRPRATQPVPEESGWGPISASTVSIATHLSPSGKLAPAKTTGTGHDGMTSGASCHVWGVQQWLGPTLLMPRIQTAVAVVREKVIRSQFRWAGQFSMGMVNETKKKVSVKPSFIQQIDSEHQKKYGYGSNQMIAVFLSKNGAKLNQKTGSLKRRIRRSLKIFMFSSGNCLCFTF